MEQNKISNCVCPCTCCRTETDKNCNCKKENNKIICSHECCIKHIYCCDLDSKIKSGSECLHECCNLPKQSCGPINTCCKIQGDKLINIK